MLKTFCVKNKHKATDYNRGKNVLERPFPLAVLKSLSTLCINICEVKLRPLDDDTDSFFYQPNHLSSKCVVSWGF